MKIKALALTIQKVLARLKFSKNRSRSNVKVKRYSTNKNDLITKYIYVNIKALALTIEKLLARLKFSV